MSEALGRHILVEFFGCTPDVMNDVVLIEKSMVGAAEEALATVINATFHHFSPYGVSGVVVIQESHLAIHTWPEFGYAAVDLFTCGDSVNPWVAYDYLKEAFGASHGSAMEIKRGQPDLLERVDVDYLTRDRKEMKEDVKRVYKRDTWFTDKNSDVAHSLRLKENLIYREKSEYQLVQVVETHAYGKMLAIDNLVMATEKDEFIYHEIISHVPMLIHPNPKKVLVIGGGDGGTIREVLKHEEVESVTMVEIDEKVVEASKQFLPTLSCAFDHPKLDLRFADGIQYLKDSTSDSFDVIIVDGSDPLGPAEGLFSESFYKDVYRCLSQDGILVIQSEGPHFNADTMVENHHCLRTIFGEAKVHTYLAYIPTYPTGMWSFIYASKGSVHPLTDLNDIRADKFGEKHQLGYYSAEMHRAAFVLPPFVKKMIE